MNRLLFIIVSTLMLTGPAMAQKGITPEFSPFVPKVIQKVKTLESKVAQLEQGAAGVYVAKAVLDCTSTCEIGTRNLGVNLPAKALIKQSWFIVLTQFTDSGSGTVALHCEDAGNIFTATDITGSSAGTITSGVSTGTAANMRGGIAAQCPLTATIAGSDQTAGVLNLFVEYVIHN